MRRGTFGRQVKSGVVQHVLLAGESAEDGNPDAVMANPGPASSNGQLSFFPDGLTETDPGEHSGAPVRVHLCLPDTSSLRVAWNAVYGHPLVQVVSTGPGALADVDVRVEVQESTINLSQQETRAFGRTVLIIREVTDESLSTALLRNAWAVVPEWNLGSDLLPMLLAVGRGECPILGELSSRPELAATLLQRYALGEYREEFTKPVPNPLTDRENAILEAIAAGETSRTIASMLGIGIQTVKNHVSQILRKTGAHTRAEALAVATRSGWLIGNAAGDIQAN